MVITRGSWRAGSLNRAVIGATASHPTNESISVEAARPIDSQPCGANGVQFAARAAGAEPATATTTTTISSAMRTSWAAVVARTPPRARPSTASSMPPATVARMSWPPPVSSVT
jgi:hypothetical protein